MKTYLKITNNGLIEIEDLTLVGSSTKHGIEGKIGEFGSGNKFALAWYFRNECVPTIMRGTEELKLGGRIVLHRNTPVQVITVNDEYTSITFNMGPKWTGWMALRETISNAIDEGGFELKTVFNPELKGEEGKTIYYIPLNDELENVTNNFNHYFSINRTPLFSNAKGEVFGRSSDTFNLYRQGIRCWDETKKVNLDINLFDLEINESRLTSEGHFDRRVRDFIQEGISKEIMMLFLTSEYVDIMPRTFSAHNLEAIKDLVAEGKRFGTYTKQKLSGLLGTLTYDYIVRDELYDQLVKENIIEGVMTTLQAKYVITENSEKLAEIAYFLKAFNINLPLQNVITHEFGVSCWEDNRILVNIDINNNHLYTNIEVAHTILKNIPIDYFESKL